MSKNLKDNIPYPIKQGIKYLYGKVPLSYRYGKKFRDTYNLLMVSQWWTKQKIEEYQMGQLDTLLKHAYENVPYYRRIFDERGIKPKDIRSISDLKRLPYLTKDDFRNRFREMLATNRNLSKLRMSNTSGTSGKPLQFYSDREEAENEMAFVFHLWSRVGYQIEDSRVQLKGAIIDGERPYIYDPLRRVLRLSPRIDNEDTVKTYLERINNCGAKFLHGYPSAIGYFAFMIKRYKLPVLFQLKSVLLASEAVYPWQRQIIEDVFRCGVFSFYGMTEHVVIAGESEETTDFQCVPQYGITEIDPETREIIGTGFLNHANPFIRYKTTDIADGIYPAVPSHFRRQYYPCFKTIEGRLEDFIISPRGIPISPAVLTHPFKKFSMIKNTQIIQVAEDCLLLNIVPWEGYKEEILNREIKELAEGLRDIVGCEMSIQSEIVENIQLTKAGKFKWIISDIAKESLVKGL